MGLSIKRRCMTKEVRGMAVVCAMVVLAGDVRADRRSRRARRGLEGRRGRMARFSRVRIRRRSIRVNCLRRWGHGMRRMRRRKR